MTFDRLTDGTDAPSPSGGLNAVGLVGLPLHATVNETTTPIIASVPSWLTFMTSPFSSSLVITRRRGMANRPDALLGGEGVVDGATQLGGVRRHFTRVEGDDRAVLSHQILGEVPRRQVAGCPQQFVDRRLI